MTTVAWIALVVVLVGLGYTLGLVLGRRDAWDEAYGNGRREGVRLEREHQRAQRSAAAQRGATTRRNRVTGEVRPVLPTSGVLDEIAGRAD